jgi:flagellin
MRINQNISAVNAHRNLTRNSEVQSRNMERLASGLKVNRGADGPAALVISERLRAQVSGLSQAIDNSEAGISLVQTAEAALNEVSAALINARQLAVHAANEAVNDPFMLQADQQEIANILDTVDRIASNTQYGHNTLLDGSKGSNGVTSGENLEFVSATQATKSSGPGGYAVGIKQVATRAQVTGTRALDQALIDDGEQITITEGAKTVSFTTMKGESVEANLNALEKSIKEAGLSVDVIREPQGEANPNAAQILSFRHKEYGSEHSFTVASTTAGVISQGADVSDSIRNGKDVQGEINGEVAFGKGQILTGGPGSANTEGLAIRYTGTALPGAGAVVAPAEGEEGAQAQPAPAVVQGDWPPIATPANQVSPQELAQMPSEKAGTVTVSQNSLVFQIGANANQTTSMSMRSMKTNTLGRGVANEAGFRSLAEINVQSADKAQDTIRVLDKALEEVSSTRAELGAFQKNSLQSNLNYLRIAQENVMSSESVIRDADMAEEMTQFTRNQIMTESSTAMLAQAHQRSMSVMKLIG